MTPQKQGYVFIAITMCIWGGFTLTARLSANWGIGAWDITALRFLLAFCILMPILIYKKDTAFLWKKEPFILAMPDFTYSHGAPRSVHRLDWIFENPSFTVDGYSSSDIKQGKCGDCWWLAGLASIAHRRDIMDKICVARDEECGIYGFVFWKDGEWITTIIDDNLFLKNEDYGKYTDTYDVSGKKARLYRKEKQTGSKALYFSHCENENETWVPLLEKAVCLSLYPKRVKEFWLTVVVRKGTRRLRSSRRRLEWHGNRGSHRRRDYTGCR